MKIITKLSHFVDLYKCISSATVIHYSDTVEENPSPGKSIFLAVNVQRIFDYLTVAEESWWDFLDTFICRQNMIDFLMIFNKILLPFQVHYIEKLFDKNRNRFGNLFENINITKRKQQRQQTREVYCVVWN